VAWDYLLAAGVRCGGDWTGLNEDLALVFEASADGDILSFMADQPLWLALRTEICSFIVQKS
jgi:hypothetical protein